MNIKTLKLEDLNPAVYNPRRLTDSEFDGLIASIRQFGQQENLIVNKDLTIISGHQRYEAMKFLELSEAVCNVVDVDKKTEKKLNLVMNNPAIQGSFVDEEVAEILEELRLDPDYEALRLEKLEPLDGSDGKKKRQLLQCPECHFQGEIGDYSRSYEEK